MTTYDDRRQWVGTEPPAIGSPARRPGSVRRTTSIDLVRPAGITGPLHIVGNGRDLATDLHGVAHVAAVASSEVVVDYVGGRVVTGVDGSPAIPELAQLVGVSAGSGFRRSLGERVPGLATTNSLLYLLLDETTPATLISGSVFAREGLIKLAAPGPGSRLPIDICAGWQAGGAMLGAIAETGVPLLGWGPPAPDLEPIDDDLAWHEMDSLAPGSMRRRRLIDVGPMGPGPDPGSTAVVQITVRFRDSYWEKDGTETVVHEYALSATADPDGWRITSAAAVPGPLPAPECPSAAASAGRIVGVEVGRLRETVREQFTGTTTCTHLNDVFRSLTDVAHLWSLSIIKPDPETETPQEVRP